MKVALESKSVSTVLPADVCLPDGRIESFEIRWEDPNDAGRSSALVTLSVRKKIGAHLEPCRLLLRFVGLLRVDILEDFSSGADYSEITLCDTPEGIYLSLDPYGSVRQPDQRDNMVVVSSAMSAQIESADTKPR